MYAAYLLLLVAREGVPLGDDLDPLLGARRLVLLALLALLECGIRLAGRLVDHEAPLVDLDVGALDVLLEHDREILALQELLERHGLALHLDALERRHGHDLLPLALGAEAAVGAGARERVLVARDNVVDARAQLRLAHEARQEDVNVLGHQWRREHGALLDDRRRNLVLLERQRVDRFEHPAQRMTRCVSECECERGAREARQRGNNTT